MPPSAAAHRCCRQERLPPPIARMFVDSLAWPPLFRVDPAVRSPATTSGIQAVDAGRAWSHGHDVAHGGGVWRRVLALVVPLGAFGNGFVLELVHGGVAHVAFDHAVTPRVDDSGHGPVARDVFAVVPRVPRRIDVLWNGHPTNLEGGRHPTLRVLHPRGKDLLAQ